MVYRLHSVSDIVRIKEPSAEDLYDDYEAVIKYVEKLRDDILDFEAKHKREEFVEFNEVKSRLTSFMEEVFSKGRSFKENYQTKAVSGLDSFADYNTALMAAESYIESTQERYEKALAAEAIRIEKLKAEQRIVDGLKQTAWALVDVAAIGLAIMSGGTLAPISVAILTFSAAEITEGAGNIYLGITGDGSSIAFNPIRDTLFMGNQDVYNVASLAVNIADMKLSKPKVSSLDDIARFGAKSVEAKGINRVKDLTKKLLGKVDDIGDVKKGGKGFSAVDEAVEAVGKGSKKAAGKGGSKAIDNAIPNVQIATINPKKLTEYALDPNHPVGGNKAKVFESALGYNQSNADDLMRQIYEKLPSSEAVLGKLDEYGQRYTVDIPITGPNGNTVNVRTGWIIKTGSDIPELTTIYVKD